MKEYMGHDYLIKNKTGLELYEKYAKDMPIFDYHNHLIPKEIYENKGYENITQVWLYADHYKWRTMRACGVDEKYITGDASDKEKFLKFAEVVPNIIGSPVYHWVAMELKEYFGITKPLNPSTAEEIWTICNEKLQGEDFRPVGLLDKMKVKAICTTDDPFDSLEYHKKIKAEKNLPFKVLPSFRPDKVLHIEQAPFIESIGLLANSTGVEIKTFEDLKIALEKAIENFVSAGCLVSDHGFILFSYSRTGDGAAAFAKALAGETLTSEEVTAYKSEVLRYLGSLYKKNNIKMQLHLGAQRNNNTKLFNKIGADKGIDSVGAITSPGEIGAYLDDLELAGNLPNTVLYNLNPGDNMVLSSMAGNFWNGEIPGKVQLGSAWWFLDNVRGIRNQIIEIMEAGAISASVGMLTDSRSFTSFARHDYYRRILCDTIGALVENGEYPCDIEHLGNMVQNISYNNAVRYFGLK